MDPTWISIIGGGAGSVLSGVFVWIITKHLPKEQEENRKFNRELLAQHQQAEKEAREAYAVMLKEQREHDDRKHETIFGHIEKQTTAIQDLHKTIIKGEGCHNRQVSS